MKRHGPAFIFWQAALNAYTPAAFCTVMDDFIDAVCELFPVEVHGKVTIEARDQWEGVAERLEWAGCRDYARFLQFGRRVLAELDQASLAGPGLKETFAESGLRRSTPACPQCIIRGLSSSMNGR